MSNLMYKVSVLLILFAILLGTTVGCNKQTNIDNNIPNNSSSTEQQNSIKKGNKLSLTNKKIVYIRENEEGWMIDQQYAIFRALVDSGYSDINVVKFEGSRVTANNQINNIKSLNPELIIVSTDKFAHEIIKQEFEDTKTPVIVLSYIELMGLVDGWDNPLKNITGIKTFTENVELSAFRLLDYITPIEGKKAVFFNDPSIGLFPEKKVKDALKELNIELKDYVVTRTQSEWREATLRYSSDSEVGWIIIGNPPSASGVNTKNELTWFANNSTKPSVSFSDTATSAGVLASLSTNNVSVGEQAVSMATKIFSGTNINKVVAERPRHINIILNTKTAKKLGIEFSNDILGSAFKIYTDYDGKFLPQ